MGSAENSLFSSPTADGCNDLRQLAAMDAAEVSCADRDQPWDSRTTLSGEQSRQALSSIEDEAPIRNVVSDPVQEGRTLLSSALDLRPASMQAAPKVVQPKPRRKVVEVQKLVSEQGRIKSAVEASTEGYWQLESQLQSFMAEVEEKRANAEAVILDLVKELVRTAQEVESMNSQGALMEERLDSVQEQLQALESHCASRQEEAPAPPEEPHVLQNFAEDDHTLAFAPAARCAADRNSYSVGVPRSSERARGRREVATWSDFVAPGEKLVAKSKERLAARTLGSAGDEKAVPKTNAVNARSMPEPSRKLVEAAVGKATAEALERAKAALRELGAELAAELRGELRAELASVAAEREKAAETALKQVLAEQLDSALRDVKEAGRAEKAGLPVGLHGSAEESKEGRAPSPMPAGSVASGQPRLADPAQAENLDSPKALTSKKPRTSFRMMGALACLGVVKKPELEEPN